MKTKLLLTFITLTIIALLTQSQAQHTYSQISQPDVELQQATTGWQNTVVDSGDINTTTSLAVDSAGNPHISYFKGSNLTYANANQNGWNSETVTNSMFPYSSKIGIDANDVPHITYFNLNPAPTVFHAEKPATNWSIEAVNNGEVKYSYATLALDNANQPHTTWIELEFSGAVRGLYHGYQLAYDSWFNSNTGQTADNSTRAALVFDNTNTLHMSYNTNGLQYATRNSSGQWSSGVLIDGNGTELLDIAVDSNNYPHIAYVVGSNQLWYAYKDASGWTTTYLTMTNSINAVSLAIDSNDYPHIALSDWGSVRYYYQDTSGWYGEQSVTGVDILGAALDLDANDTPHISFANGNLNYVTQDSSGGHQYISFDNYVLTLYPYEGEHVALLVNSPTLDETTLSQIVATFDGAYEYYRQATGREPNLYYNYNGLNSVAVAPSTCSGFGAGCGFLGSTGIEMTNDTFDTLYNGVHSNNEYDQVVFYELGRNFWFYSDQIAYKSPDSGGSIITGYAVFMRFMAMEATGVTPGPYNGTDFSIFEDEVRGLFYTYLENESLDWYNTLKIGQAPSNTLGLGSTDLFASFLFKLRDMFDDQFILNLWKEVGNRPAAATTQDAVDNFVLAASAAANKNLTGLFHTWRWPISSSAWDEAINLYGASYFPGDLVINYETGKPGSVFRVIGTGFPPNETATISVNGRILSTSIPVNSSGYFSLLLYTNHADEGTYTLTAEVNPTAAITFTLDDNAPLHAPEGSGEAIDIPAGIGSTQYLFLPAVLRN